MEIIHTDYDSLTKHEKTVLLAMTNRKPMGSGMRNAFSLLKNKSEEIVFNHIIYIKIKEEIVSWSLIVHRSYYKNKFELVFYTKVKYRRMGYGRILHDEAVRFSISKNKRYKIFPQNNNKEFFKKIGYNVRIDGDFVYMRKEDYVEFNKKKQISLACASA